MAKTKKIIFDWRLAALLSAAFLLQLPGVFFGFEETDTGFYMVFYDNIFSHPQTVQYHFMYYLTGIVGGMLHFLTGGSLLGLRIAGALCNMVCVWIVWGLVGGKGRMLAVAGAVVAVSIANWMWPTTFYGDPFTVLLALGSLSLAIKSMERHGAARRRLAFWSGMIAGVNLFSRLPNALEIIFVVMYPLCLGRREGWREVCKVCAVWIGGWIAGVGAVVLLALCLGHGSLLMSAFTNMIDMAQPAQGECTHNSGKLLEVNMRFWVTALYIAVKIAAVCVGLRLTWRLIKRRGGLRDNRQRWIVMAVPVLFWLFMCLRWVYNLYFLTDMCALALAGSCVVCLYDGDVRLKRAAVASVIMMVLLPVGSDGAMRNIGAVLLWLPLSVALMAPAAILPKRMAWAVTALFAALVIYKCADEFHEKGFYGDPGPVSEMCAQVEVPRLGGIFTSESNAAYTERRLAGLQEYVQEGDTVMMFDWMPMLNYAGRTCPAIGCSWIGIISTQQFGRRLETSPKPQWIMKDHVRIVDMNDYAGKERLLQEYIEKNRYEMVKQTTEFSLYKRKN